MLATMYYLLMDTVYLRASCIYVGDSCVYIGVHRCTPFITHGSRSALSGYVVTRNWTQQWKASSIESLHQHYDGWTSNCIWASAEAFTTAQLGFPFHHVIMSSKRAWNQPLITPAPISPFRPSRSRNRSRAWASTRLVGVVEINGGKHYLTVLACIVDMLMPMLMLFTGKESR